MSVTPATDRMLLRLQVYVLRPRNASANDFRQQNGTVNKILDPGSVKNTVINKRESIRQSMTKLRFREGGSADDVADEYEVVRKFVHLTHPLISIALLHDEIAERYRRIYGESLEITSLKDDSNCDFDMEYLASYVFTNGSVINVIASLNDDLKPAALEVTNDVGEEEQTEHDEPVYPQNASDKPTQTWLSNAAAEMTETAKRSLMSLRTEEPDDKSNSNRIESPLNLHSSQRERSPSLTPDDSSSYFQSGSSTRLTKRRRQAHEASPEIPESVIEESQAAYVPTQVDEVNKLEDMQIYRGESYTASDFGPKVVARRRRRSSGLSDFQLNPRLSLPPVISSDADVSVDPQKHLSSGHATATSSPVAPLFVQSINNDNASITSVPMPSLDEKAASPAVEAERPPTENTDMTTEVPGEEGTVAERQPSKETSPLPTTNGGLELDASARKIIHQLKDAKGELAKVDAKKGSKRTREFVAKKAPAVTAVVKTRQPRKRTARKRAARNTEDQVTNQTAATELERATAAPAGVAEELVDNKSTSAPEQAALEKEEGPNEDDESSRAATVSLAPLEPDIAEVDNQKALYGSFDEEILKRVRIKLAQAHQPAQGHQPAETTAKRRGAPPKTKNKPKVPPTGSEEAEHNAVAKIERPKATSTNNVPFPPTSVQGEDSGGPAKATGAEPTATVPQRITKLRIPRVKPNTRSPAVRRIAHEITRG
ncbi:hypothetical protein V1525DRAFT_404671 [Lipomyces kononenkoae]|uniref:Uncharacterized protein n=1 Tax=Lipomyces kononenkoae TaxID=34357 RepID=A0ACC3T1H8_LIPKO